MHESTASFLDKTDWRITLHKKLEACVDTEGTVYYPKAVKSLVSAVSATYPGWDAKTDVEKQIKFIEKKYFYILDEWLEENPTSRRTKKYKKISKLNMAAHKELFEFIKNMCARKRMLLWGTKKIPGGVQLEYED